MDTPVYPAPPTEPGYECAFAECSTPQDMLLWLHIYRSRGYRCISITAGKDWGYVAFFEKSTPPAAQPVNPER